MKWVNSGDEVLIASANQEFAGLLAQGATYIDYLKKQRDQILEVDVAARTKEQNKQLRTLNDQIAEETKRTVLEQFNQELSEQLTNAKSVIEMLNIIERRRQELANDGTELDTGKKEILDDAEKDARKQAKEQTEALLEEYASYTDKRRAIEEQFNKDIEMLTRARNAATTDADRASIDAAIANRCRQYTKTPRERAMPIMIDWLNNTQGMSRNAPPSPKSMMKNAALPVNMATKRCLPASQMQSKKNFPSCRMRY